MNRIHFEQILWDEGLERVMGLDEVGRGCLAGPVVAAGVIFKPGTFDGAIRDSKALSLKERLKLSQLIQEKAGYWTIQWCLPREIDELNILHASLEAMKKCSEQPDACPDYLLVDGNKFSAGNIPHKCIVKGDDRSMSIAAASIIAKVYRDRWMQQLHDEFPYYSWNTNVGYPTADHYEGLKEYGATKYHRQSFKLRTDKKITDILEEK